MTEQQWIARARHGDADAFEQLVVAYEGPVYRLALRMCGSAEDAREVTQDAFLGGMAWPAGFPGRQPLLLMAVPAYHQCRHRLPASGKAPSGEPPAGGGPGAAGSPAAGASGGAERAAGGPAKGAGSAVTGTPTGAAAAGGAANELRRDRTGSVAGERHGEIPYQPGPPPAAGNSPAAGELLLRLCRLTK